MELRWIPGRRGYEGNEKAEELAKKETITPFIDTEPECGMSKAAVEKCLENWIKSETRFRGKLCATGPARSQTL